MCPFDNPPAPLPGIGNGVSQMTFAPFSQEGEGPGGKLAKTLKTRSHEHKPIGGRWRLDTVGGRKLVSVKEKLEKNWCQFMFRQAKGRPPAFVVTLGPAQA